MVFGFVPRHGTSMGISAPRPEAVATANL